MQIYILYLKIIKTKMILKNLMKSALFLPWGKNSIKNKHANKWSFKIFLYF